MKWLQRILPFVGWFRDITGSRLRVDLLAGVTVAMVLIPQSMAYAQLAGLPAYYGLYASFLPPMVAALFGSSHQLATGPVAVVSLMTAAALEPLATAGSETYCAYAILLAVLVGAFQFSLGVLRLGAVVNFISHPVVNAFTTAAAIIIATSQLSKIFGVYVDKGEHHYETLIAVVIAAFEFTHLPTLLFAAAAFAIMVTLKRLYPRVPNVLVAVAVTTVVSWAASFQKDRTIHIDDIRAAAVVDDIGSFNAAFERMLAAQEKRAALTPEIIRAEQEHGATSVAVTQLRHEVALLNLEISELKTETGRLRKSLRSAHLEGGQRGEGAMVYYPRGEVPEGATADGERWRVKVKNKAIDSEKIALMGGGAVVGTIPEGLPTLAMPAFDFSIASQLVAMAVIISLLGFMEAISIAKAMAARTQQRLDPNQELIGQGLANIIGCMGQSYPASGSFSRSAVNLAAGAVSGLSSVFTSAVVVITLLFLTPLLYHLPQAVLAAIIMMAVIGLINVSGFVHAWKSQRYDGIISVITFVATLGFAPHLDKGIMIGVVLSIGVYLYRNMRPHIAVLSKHADGSFRNAERHGLAECEHVAVIRFSGSLIFANASYLEEKVNEEVGGLPDLRHVVIVGNAINELDSSGEEMLSLLVDRLREAGYEVSFSGLNDAVLDCLRRTGLYNKIGEENLFRSVRHAIEVLHERSHEGSTESPCPLVEAVEKRGAA